MSPEEDLLARLLYRDAMMLVINKPAGIAVHAGPQAAFGSTDHLERHFDALKFGLPRAPSLAHRLDRDTSGCLVLGRHRRALEDLGKMFKSGRIDKMYWTVVEGSPSEEEGHIDLPLGRRDETRGWWMKIDPNGMASQTNWTVLGRGKAPEGQDLTWLAMEPVTGRTHQLRVHAQAMGWPIYGDPIYGHAPRSGGPGLHLHSRSITIPLYKNKEPITVVAPPPEGMLTAIGLCGWKPD